MGLDMYLRKEHYIGANFEHNNVTGKVQIKVGDKPVNLKLNEITSIITQAGYWRKASHIHNWFVQNVQKGVDDCGSYYVPLEKLEQLLVVCEKVLEARNTKEGKLIAENELPTTSGFFFGQVEYDDYYYNTIKNTIKIIKSVLEDKETFVDVFGNMRTSLPYSLYYHSSW